MAARTFIPGVTDFPKPRRQKPAAPYIPFVTDFPRAQPKSPVPFVPGVTDFPGAHGQNLDPNLIPATGGGGTGIGTGTGTDAGSTTQKPGYMTELTSDPLYIQALGRYNTMMQQGRDTLRNQIRNAVISSGYTPDFSGPQNQDLAGYADDLDQATLAAAQGNQTSQRAQLERGYQQGLTNLDYSLAARGSGLDVHGGANVVRTGLLKDQRDLAANQQMSGLIDAIRGGIGGYHQQEQSLWGDLTSAQSEVASRLAQLQGPVYDQATTTSPEDTTAAPSAAAPGVTTAAGGPAVNWGGKSFTTKIALTQYLNAIRAQNPRNAITAAQFRAQHPTAWARLT